MPLSMEGFIILYMDTAPWYGFIAPAERTRLHQHCHRPLSSTPVHTLHLDASLTFAERGNTTKIARRSPATARAGKRRFLLLSTSRAHTKTPYKNDLL